MMDFLNAVSGFLRGIAALVLAGVVGFASWVGYDFYTDHIRLDDQLKQSQAEIAQKAAQIETLNASVVEKQREIERLDMAVRLLKVDHRLADIVVLDQWKSDADNRLMTKFAFQEVDDQGQPLEEAKQFTIDGDMLYVDAWIVKYDDKLVEKGDPLRSTSLCLLRRLFGEFQEASKGFELDKANTRPVAYGRGPMSDYEKEIWTNFWEYANDPARAKKAGIRAAHGEAPSGKLRPGLLYKLQLRASGGMSIEPEELPPNRRPL